MTNENSLKLLLEVDVERGLCIGEGPARAPGILKRLWGLVLSAGVAVAMLADPALAKPPDAEEFKEKISTEDPGGGDPVMWEPANSTELIMNEAQWESPLAPLVFWGGQLNTGASFETGREFLIGKQAVINTHGDTVLNLSGPIASYMGSRESLVKLGAGTLVLSVANTYNGNTQLLQGGLDVMGNSALGAGSRTLNVNTGTRLRYAPGITVGNGVQMQATDISLHVPADSYTNVVPPDYADSVQWMVDSGQATQTGPLAGSAPIVKQGAGLLHLLGPAMAYSGLFTVNQGTLAVDDVFWGPVQVNQGARLQGVGQVGATTVMAGGTLASGNRLGVYGNGATLPGGMGSAADSTFVSGLGVGSVGLAEETGGVADIGIGALTVRGNLVFQPNSRFEIRVTPQGLADSVQVTGKAELDGKVIALAQAGDWQPSTRYTVLRAEQGLGDTHFASVQTDLAFLTPTLSYSDQEVMLALDRNDTPFEEVAETPNEEEVAQVLDEEPQGTDPVVVDPGSSSLPDRIVQLDETGARQAFEQLSGSWAASVQSSLHEDSRFIRQAVLQQVNPFAPGLTGLPASRVVGAGRLNGGHCRLCTQDASVNTVRAWSQAFYSSANRDANKGVPGDARDIGGVVLGINRPVGPDWSAGAYFGAQHSRLWRNASIATANIDSAHLGLNLAGRWRGALLTLGATHTWHAIRSQRQVSAGSLRDSLSSRYHAQSDQVFGEASLPFTPFASAPSVTLEPFTRLAWVYTRTQGFTEEGGPAALDVQPASQATWLSSLGLKLTQAIETASGAAQLQARLAWRYASGSLQSTTQQSFRDSVNQAVFMSEGQPLARSVWQFELGLQAQLAKTVKLGVGYAGQFASGLQDHGARMELAWAF